MKCNKTHKTYGGLTRFFEHDSNITKTPMKFSTFSAKEKADKAILWLSGLTCNEENFMTKAGAQQKLADTDIMIICPDTSPRGLDLPGEHDSYDFGSGAGFYLTATTDGYKDHYKMDQYLLDELIPLLKKEFGINSISLMGHSMGGHGALTLGLKNPEVFQSISAFSPIVNPLQCPWGQKAFKGYLGEKQDSWKAYDSCELIKAGKKSRETILIDQGTADEFLEKELLTSHLENVAKECDQPIQVNYREGYDHSYYFIQSFIADHIDFHAKHLK
jgi:S-formylglutathione hydrolase